jgi:hypothetical protein
MMNDILESSKRLIKIVNDISKKSNITNTSQLAKFIIKFHPIYTSFQKNHMLIFKGIITQSIKLENIHILEIMLKKQKEMQSGLITQQQATSNISDLLAKEHNVDWNKLKKQQ